MNLDGTAHHAMIEDGLQVLKNLDHRGARGAEPNTGDGAGMLLQKPHEFFRQVVSGLPAAERYGVGQFFLPADPDVHPALRRVIDVATWVENRRLPSVETVVDAQDRADAQRQAPADD